MKHQQSRGSALIYWITDDAAYVVDQVRKGQRTTAPDPWVAADPFPAAPRIGLDQGPISGSVAV
jgi:hypothetical protein